MVKEKEVVSRLREIVAQPTSKGNIERKIRGLIQEIDPYMQEAMQEIDPYVQEIEDGRLCRFEVGMFLEAYGRYYKDEDNGESKVTPVHRRWSELTEEERYSFARSVGSLVTSGIYRTAYRLITGEEHP